MSFDEACGSMRGFDQSDFAGSVELDPPMTVMAEALEASERGSGENSLVVDVVVDDRCPGPTAFALIPATSQR